MDKQDFFDGTVFDAWRWFGAHIKEQSTIFRVFAPNAAKITLTGAFNDWKENELTQDGRSGFWEVSLPNAHAGQYYKYRITSHSGMVVEHCDPYGFAMELRPGCCSIITDPDEYHFTDTDWMSSRTAALDAPLNIYELHLGSWKRNPADENGWYRYDEIADLLIPYLCENGFTHVEFLPLSEHPFDGSWGYQNTGFFAPTSRYGSPAQLKMLIDRLHHAGIGAIMDFVPVHFAVDGYGLAQFDGTPLYEYPHPDVGESEWGSCNFIHSRREVRCFLQSAANYWLEEFHFDGLLMDAVSRLIYWQGDPARGVNGETLNFLKQMNAGLKARHPSALLIAEDSTTFPGVTRPVSRGGLGFDYKWDLGWMHDTLTYMQTPPDKRAERRGQLLFSMKYFPNEHYLLPLSHDEVVHGKAAIVQKMWGADLTDKYAQARAFYLYMFAHPGKKLNFMGNELGLRVEWSEAAEPDWTYSGGPFHVFFRSLSQVYRAHPALHTDYMPDSFRWLPTAPDAPCVFAWERRSAGEHLVAVCNFSDKPYTFSAPLPNAAILLNTDWAHFGGQFKENHPSWGQNPDIFTVTLTKFSAILLEIDKNEIAH
ncbi:1,4-alpha-glucan branching protein GlgB [Candidatus Agathobaculum pullicola]|uniref:1,4-alpha-glucan branching protein GlgB n=1 Tax=Candidatus Agathobaculum pullicola TaxID=2838426 RepID=UPI003F8F5A14